jgi:hypothetical protein
MASVSGRPIGALALMLLVCANAARAQDQTPPPAGQASTSGSAPTQAPATTTTPIGQPKLYIDLNKIRSALAAPPAVDLTERQLGFYVLVYARQPKFTDFIGKFDLKNGPVPRAAMTHQDFLNRVTPKELYSNSGGITALEALQFAITNMAAQTIIKRGLEDIRNARDESEIRAIRARIDRELAALAGKG